MRHLLFASPFVLLTCITWGLYGPMLHHGQLHLGDAFRPASLRPLICVGIAYFLIAVLVPGMMLRVKGEQGRWTVMGAFWSFLGGAISALGALCLVLAFSHHGDPVYVMPLVFGLAPVVTTCIMLWVTRAFKEASLLFFAGVVLVAAGTAGLLSFQPGPARAAPLPTSESGDTISGTEVASAPAAGGEAGMLEKLALIPLFIALAAICWGCHGPILHKGQIRMGGSRLRPFLCVGLAYLVIAVVIPLPLLQFSQEPVGFKLSGTLWSLAGGAASALGALGILMAFNFGGKPTYVMPLVFAGVPIVNTFAAVGARRNFEDLSPLFLASLIVVIAGAATVWFFSPRGAKAAAVSALAEQRGLEDDEETVRVPAADGSRSESSSSDHDEGEEETIGDEETFMG